MKSLPLPCKQSLVWYYLKVFRLSGIPGSVRREQNGLQFPGVFKGIPTDLMPPPLSPANKSQDIHNGHSTPPHSGQKGWKVQINPTESKDFQEHRFVGPGFSPIYCMVHF